MLHFVVRLRYVGETEPLLYPTLAGFFESTFFTTILSLPCAIVLLCCLARYVFEKSSFVTPPSYIYFLTL